MSWTPRLCKQVASYYSEADLYLMKDPKQKDHIQNERIQDCLILLGSTF